MSSKYYIAEEEWIGRIPSSWNLIKGKFLFNNKKEINKSIRCKNLLSLTLNGVLNKDKDSGEGLRPETYETYQIFQKDDLVFKLIDLENVNTSRVGIVHEEGIMSPVYLRLEPIKSEIFPKFSYWFYYDLYKKEIYNSIGSGVRSALSPSDLLELKLPVPPLKEQILISRYLDKKILQINSLIKNTKQKITLLKEIKNCIINHYLTNGLNQNQKMKDCKLDCIGKIPIHWQVISLKHLVSTPITDGPHETPEFKDKGIPFLSVESIVDNKIIISKMRSYISEELFEEYSKKCRPQRNDIFLVKSGSTTGKSAIVETDEKFSVWSPLCLIRSKIDKINPYYLFRSIQSFYFIQSVEKNWSFGTQPNIGMRVIENLPIVVPPLDEQKLILAKIEPKLLEIENYIKIEIKRTKLFGEYHNKLISDIITGKINISEEDI